MTNIMLAIVGVYALIWLLYLIFGFGVLMLICWVYGLITTFAGVMAVSDNILSLGVGLLILNVVTMIVRRPSGDFFS